jgi:PAS domain S-box-containing protein
VTTAHNAIDGLVDPASATDVDLYAALLQGRMRGGDAVEACQQLLQALMDSSANAVFWKDLQSRYIGCNHVFAAFAGSEPADLLGKSDRDMPWADDIEFGADWFMGWDAHVASTGEPVMGIVERLRRASGDLRWVETNKVPLRDLDGRVIGILGTFEDVTERRAAEERLNRTLADLDKRVQQRTRDLERAIESLRREVDDRVRVQAEERQQRAYAEALRDTASAMSKTLDVQEVLEQVLIGVERLVSNDLTAILLLDSDERLEIARCRVGFGYTATVSGEGRAVAPPIESLTVVDALRRGESAIVDDPASALGPAGSTLGAALRTGDRNIGFVVVESVTKGFFTAAHAERLRAIADQAAAAISNARLAGQATELAAAEERQRLSQELHDAVNQTLWTAALTADSVLREADPGTPLYARLERLRQLTAGAQAEMRTLLLELRPQELAEIELDELLEQLIAAMECRKKMDVAVRLERVDLDPEARIACYRIAQEALTNITRHAAATAASISLRHVKAGGPTAASPVELRIADNGRGFDAGNVPPGHLGLSIMQERAAAVGAELTVRAAPGHGTELILLVAK